MLLKLICRAKPRTMLRYIHTTDYYSTVRRKELLTHAVTWANLKIIVASRRSQPWKHDSISVHNSRKCKLISWERKQISCLETEWGGGRDKKKRFQRVRDIQGWMDQQNVLYGYNSDCWPLKREGILTHATAWMNLAVRSQSPKNKYRMISGLWGT